MKKPELKVVRFEAEDVIATSAYTWGKEINQAKGSSNYQSDSYYTLSFSGNEVITDPSNYTNVQPSGFYAWYNENNSDNKWYTDKNNNTETQSGDEGMFFYNNGWQPNDTSGSLWE